MKIRISPNHDLVLNGDALRQPIDAVKSLLLRDAHVPNRTQQFTPVQIRRRNAVPPAAAATPTIPATAPTLPGDAVTPGELSSFADANTADVGDVVNRWMSHAREQVEAEGNKNPPVLRGFTIEPPEVQFDAPSLGTLKPVLPPLYRLSLVPALASRPSEPPLHPSVAVITGRQALHDARKMLGILEADGLGPDTSPGATEEGPWKERLADTHWVLSDMESLRDPQVLAKRAEIGLRTSFEKKPSGVATLAAPEARFGSHGLQLWYIVTEPRGLGAGSALVEHAASLSEHRGFGGVLHIVPAEEAVPAFRALGFVGDERGMTLDPAAPGNRDLWQRDDGRWKLKAYLTKELVDSMQALRERAGR